MNSARAFRPFIYALLFAGCALMLMPVTPVTPGRKTVGKKPWTGKAKKLFKYTFVLLPSDEKYI